MSMAADELNADDLEDLDQQHKDDPRRMFQLACVSCIEPWPCRTHRLIRAYLRAIAKAEGRE